jgi:group I intron endonuclease
MLIVLNKGFIFTKANIDLNNLLLSGIYCIYNPETGNYYVGQGKDLRVRLYRYFCRSVLEVEEPRVIIAALIKYGHDNFIIIVLERCDQNVLDEREQY